MDQGRFLQKTRIVTLDAKKAKSVPNDGGFEPFFIFYPSVGEAQPTLMTLPVRNLQMKMSH